MKTSKLYSEGCSGIRVDLTTYDRFEIANTVKFMKRFFELADKRFETLTEEEKAEFERLGDGYPYTVKLWLCFFQKLIPMEEYNSDVFKKEMDE